MSHHITNMRSFLLNAGIFAAAAFAASTQECLNAPCLTVSSAQTVASHFESLITAFKASDAQAYLTTDFTDYSGSVNTLINGGCPNGASLDGPTFTSQAAFIAGQGKQPSIPFQ